MFELEMTICDRFPAVTPFSIRNEKMINIFKLIVKMNKYAKNVKKANPEKPKVIRRPAGDDWF